MSCCRVWKQVCGVFNYLKDVNSKSMSTRDVIIVPSGLEVLDAFSTSIVAIEKNQNVSYFPMLNYSRDLSGSDRVFWSKFSLKLEKSCTHIAY